MLTKIKASLRWTVATLTTALRLPPAPGRRCDAVEFVARILAVLWWRRGR